MRKVVVNSTPFIALFSIGKLELLKELYGRVYIHFGLLIGAFPLMKLEMSTIELQTII